MYARLQQPIVPEVHRNSALAASVATDEHGYEIPIPTEVAPPPPNVNMYETIRQSEVAGQPPYETLTSVSRR